MADAPSAAISVTGLRIARGGRRVIENVDFIAQAGRVLSVLGPNGAGKSTVVQALAGILPFEGDVTIDGAALHRLDPSTRARRIAYVPQQSQLRAALSVREVVVQGRYAHYVGRVRASAADREAVDRALELADATALSARDFTTLSQGEKQRVLIARALATGARVLLLDEPTSALDVGHALRLYRLLRALAGDGYCVVAVLHALSEALEWTDDALLLEAGRRVAFGPTQDVLRSDAIERVYGIRAVPGGALGFRLLDHEASAASTGEP